MLQLQVIMPNAYIIHRWDATPDDDWYRSLSMGLQERGYGVEIPAMPNTDAPVVKAWVEHLRETVGETDLTNAVFVGHSIGCQTIMRYFETLPRGTKVGAAVFVAGWLHLDNLEDEEAEEIAKPWLTTPIDFGKVREVCDRFVTVFSSTDPYVPLSDAELFKEYLGAEVIIRENAGHFTAEDGYSTLPPELQHKI